MNLEKIRLQKEKLILKERAAKEKERQKRMIALGHIGKLFVQANIDSLEKETLFGALLDIAKQAKDKHNQERWNQLAKDFYTDQNMKGKTPVIVSFKSGHPKKELKMKIAEFNLKWNRFRKEFYGYGNPDVIKTALSGTDAKVEAMAHE